MSEHKLSDPITASEHSETKYIILLSILQKKLYFLIISFIIVPRVSLEENNVSQPGYSFMYDLKNPASTW